MKRPWLLSLTVAAALSGCGEQLQDPALNVEALDRATLSEQLCEHVEVLASAPRAAGTEQLAAARDYCADQLAAIGFEVQRYDFGFGQNVVGTLAGHERPSEQVLLSAHIDSVAGCNGADDNASGVAGMLEAARILSQRPHARSLVAACWDREEAGLVGSLKYATAAHLLGHDIRMSFVFEMIGYRSREPGSQRLPLPAELEFLFGALFPGAYQKYLDSERRGDFIALITNAPNGIDAEGGERHLPAFERAAAERALPVQSLALSPLLMLLLPDMSRSDHASFWLNGYSAMMITDTANLRNPHYHCADGADGVDNVDSIDFDFAAQVTEAAAEAVDSALESESPQ